MPSKQWRDQLYEEGETDRPWSAGDNIQLATGQGDLQTNPLQMAIAYAALGNGGTIVTPHVGMEVEDAAGRVLKEFDPKPRRHVQIDPGYRDGDPGRPARGRAGRRAAPPTASSAASRSKSRARPGPRSARPRRPVLVRGRWLRTRTRVSSPS